MAILDDYPSMREAVVILASANGMVNRGESAASFLEKQDQVFGAEGVTTEDLRRLEAWLRGLGRDDLLTVVDGEESDRVALEATCPRNSDGVPLVCLFDDVFENG